MKEGELMLAKCVTSIEQLGADREALVRTYGLVAAKHAKPIWYDLVSPILHGSRVDIGPVRIQKC